MTKIKSFYELKDLLWKLYPCYVLYNKYNLNYYVDSIESFLNRITFYPYIILSLFNDNPIYSDLSYGDYCIAYDAILNQFILYLLDAILIRHRTLKLAEGV